MLAITPVALSSHALCQKSFTGTRLAGSRTQPAPGSIVLPRHAASPVTNAMGNTVEGSKRFKPERLHIIEKISACVEANAMVQRFEETAGRSAMVGFAVAFLSELWTPAQQGLFGSASPEELQAYLTLSTTLIVSAVVLASVSKGKQVGRQLQAAVYSSLTAISRANSLQLMGNVDRAVDAVFDSVFDQDMVKRTLIDEECKHL